MKRGLKIRIYPNKSQEEFLTKQFGAVRFVYNKALFIKKHQYHFHKKSLSPIKDLKSLLPIAKKSRKYKWLSDYDSVALCQACINLDKAFKNFFAKRTKYPKFKRVHDKQSSYHCSSIGYGSDWIKLPKLDPIKAKMHTSVVDGDLKSITITKTKTGKYYASLSIDDDIANPEPNMVTDDKKVVGLDVGLTNYYTDSNGYKEDNPRFLTRATKNLRRKQRKLSRKKKGSKERAKARLLVAKCHEKVSNARNDFQHKISSRIVDENQAIITEKLNIRGMLKNGKLAKHIGDAGWYSFLQKLKYKSEAKGKYFKQLSSKYPSSKTCSCCKHKNENLTLKMRTWTCTKCGNVHDRDINAALNIKYEGLKLYRRMG